MKIISKANIQHILILFLFILLSLGLAIHFLKLKEDAQTRPPKPAKRNTPANTNQFLHDKATEEKVQNKKKAAGSGGAPQNKKEGMDDYTGDVNRYRTDNLDVEYHSGVDEILAQNDIDNVTQGIAYVRDNEGNMVALPQTLGNITPTYYQPGSFLYSSSNFVPKYEDSVYLSRTTGQPTYSTAVPDKTKLGGFCSQTGGSMYDIEQKCNALSLEACASTSCCVLLGGKKCVLGNKMGPTFKSNYSDATVNNTEYYHYQGNCYGNCQ